MLFLGADSRHLYQHGLSNHRDFRRKAHIRVIKADTAIVPASVKLFRRDIKGQPAGISEKILVPQGILFQNNKIPVLFHGQLRKAPAVAVYDKPALLHAAGVLNSYFIFLQEELNLLFFSDFQKKLFHILLASRACRQSPVNPVILSVHAVKYPLEIFGIKQPHRFAPVGSGKVGKMKQIADCAQFGIQHACNDCDVVGNIILALIGNNPKFPFKALALSHARGVKAVCDFFFGTGEFIRKTLHPKPCGGYDALRRFVFRSGYSEASLVVLTLTKLQLNDRT